MRSGHEWLTLVSLVLASALEGCAGERIEDSPSGGTLGAGGTNESGGMGPGEGSTGSANLPEARGASQIVPTTSGCGADGDVDCGVTVSGPGYRVLASLEAGPRSFWAAATLEPVGDGSFSGTGSVGFYDVNAGNVMSETCTFEVLQTQEIGTGKVWGNLACSQSTKEANPGYSCNFEGSFLVESCN